MKETFADASKVGLYVNGRVSLFLAFVKSVRIESKWADRNGIKNPSNSQQENGRILGSRFKKTVAIWHMKNSASSHSNLHHLPLAVLEKLELDLGK